MAIITKSSFNAFVVKSGDDWIVTVEIPDVGFANASTSSFADIEYVTRDSIATASDLKPDEFDIKYNFQG